MIGTPPPAEARSLLGDADAGRAGGPPVPRQRELPADPHDPVRAKRAERVVVACFLIAMLAGLGFIAAYLIFQVHSVNERAALQPGPRLDAWAWRSWPWASAPSSGCGA